MGRLPTAGPFIPCMLHASLVVRKSLGYDLQLRGAQRTNSGLCAVPRCVVLEAGVVDVVALSNRSIPAAPWGWNMRAHRSLILGILLAFAWIAGTACWQIVGGLDGMSDQDQNASISSAARPQDEAVGERVFELARNRMVDQQLAARDVKDPRVLDAMRRVPRHLFVPENMRAKAYIDSPLPIGNQQTISQPYIVGLMTQVTRPHPDAIALDIGTGSGYQAAVLSLLCKEVYSVEIIEPLADSARQRLKDLGYKNVTVRHGDGYRGWPEKAPFDVIIVAAAPNHIPQPLIDQLKVGGRLVIPVGTHFQSLILIEKKADGKLARKTVAPVSFVPMTGDAVDRK